MTEDLIRFQGSPESTKSPQITLEDPIDPWLIKYSPKRSLILVEGQEVDLTPYENRTLTFALSRRKNFCSIG